MQRRNLILASLAALAAPSARAAARPVVLELFTSQSCSSCPPADALLGKLAQRPEVIALAWHVDYWNNLGWLDKYSSKQATARQQAYARRLGSEVFTPALIVNGASVVVGSDRSAVERAIQTAAPLTVPVTLNRTGTGTTVDVGPANSGLRALSILYDPEHSTDVRGGENDGSQLHDYRVVRQVDVLGEWDGTARSFATSLAGASQGQVILVQTADLRVVGAADQPPAERGNKST
jgi:hypothetical protein